MMSRVLLSWLGGSGSIAAWSPTRHGDWLVLSRPRSSSYAVSAKRGVFQVTRLRASVFALALDEDGAVWLPIA